MNLQYLVSVLKFASCLARVLNMKPHAVIDVMRSKYRIVVLKWVLRCVDSPRLAEGARITMVHEVLGHKPRGSRLSCHLCHRQ